MSHGDRRDHLDGDATSTTPTRPSTAASTRPRPCDRADRPVRARYFQTLDEKDWPAWAALFTDRAVLDFRGEIQHQVRDPEQRAGLGDDAFLFNGGPAAAEAFESHLRTA